jgi:hypothetical protein
MALHHVKVDGGGVVLLEDARHVDFVGEQLAKRERHGAAGDLFAVVEKVIGSFEAGQKFAEGFTRRIALRQRLGTYNAHISELLRGEKRGGVALQV